MDEQYKIYEKIRKLFREIKTNGEMGAYYSSEMNFADSKSTAEDIQMQIEDILELFDELSNEEN